MKKPDFRKHRVDSLVELFRKHAAEQEQAMLYGNQAKVNELYWQLKAVREELKSREGDQRRALLQLYNDPSPQVRIKAIKATLAVAPEKARRALEELANSKEYPASGEAGMSVWALDEGIFKPE